MNAIPILLRVAYIAIISVVPRSLGLY